MNFAEFWMGSSGGGPTPPTPPEGTANSLRFRDDASLTRTATGTSSVWTSSYWVKRGVLGVDDALFSSNGFNQVQRFQADNTLLVGLTTEDGEVYRDPSAWYNIVVANNAADTRVWVNGNQIASGINFAADAGNDMQIGQMSTVNADHYISDFYFIDGQALLPTAFGRYNEDHVWVPREVDFTPAEMRYSDELWANPTTTFTTDTSQLNKTFLSGYPATNAFDGNDSTTCIAEGAGGNWITWIGNLTNVTSLQVRSDSLQEIFVNGVLATVTPTPGTAATTYTITNPPETVTDISCQAEASANARIYAITVNGQILTNPYLYSTDLYCLNISQSAPPFDTTEKQFNPATPASHMFNGVNPPGSPNYAAGSNPGTWIVWRPSTPITVNSTIELETPWQNDQYWINEVLVTAANQSPLINWSGELTNLAIRGLASTAGACGIVKIDGQTYVDGANPAYGQNGFHLTFQDPDNIGLDTSGNENNFTANGFGTNPPNNDLLNNFSPTASLPAFNEGQDAMEDPFLFPAMFNGLATVGGSVTPGGEPAMAMSQAGGITATWNGNLSRPIGTTFSILIYRQNTPNDVTITGSNGNTVVYTAPSPADTFSTHDLTSLLDAQDITEVTSISWTRNGDPTGNGFGIGGIEIDGRRVTVDGSGADYDLMQDGPSQNYSTWNPIYRPMVTTSATGIWPYYDGNLRAGNGGSGTDANAQGTLHKLNTSNTYFEFQVLQTDNQIRMIWAPQDVVPFSGMTPMLEIVTANQWRCFNENGDIPLTQNIDVTSVVFGISINAALGTVEIFVDGVSQATITDWDNETWWTTEPCSWNMTSNGYPVRMQVAINYGQQPFLFRPDGITDEANLQTANLPAAPIVNGRDNFQALTGPGDGAAAPQLGVSDWAELVTTTGDVKNAGVASGDTYNWNSVVFNGYFANSSQGYCVLNSADASFTVTLPSSQTSRVRVSGRGGDGAVGTVTLDSGETTTWNGQSGTSTAVWTNYTNESTFTTITITGNNTSSPWFVAIEIEGVGVLTTIPDALLGNFASNCFYSPPGATVDFGTTAAFTAGGNSRSNGFDGDLTTMMSSGAANSGIVFRPDVAISATSKVEIYYIPAGNITQEIYVNSSFVNSFTSSAGSWRDISSDLTFPLTIQNMAFKGTGSFAGGYVAAIRVDDKILRDGSILGIAQQAFPTALWWIKDMVNANQHQLVDNVMFPGANSAITCPNSLAVTSDNYTAPAGDSVAWCWNAADPTTSGFNIIKNTNDGAGAVAHGLPGTPAFMIFRQYEIQDNIYTWHQDYDFNGTAWQYQVLATAAPVTYGGSNLVLAVDDTNITFGTAVTRNQIIYAWSEIPGYSAFGSYTGNNNADGPFIYTGMRSAFVMIKRTDTNGDWYVWDTTRDINNPCFQHLIPDSTNPENTNSGTANQIDILSNGFKLLSSGGNTNAAGTYVYACFAENPFGGSNVSPVTAR